LKVTSVPRLSLVEDLTSEPIPAGSNFLVEFDPSSQWYNSHVTIAAGWLKTGGKVIYHLAAQPPERVRAQLNRLGVKNVESLEKQDNTPVFPHLTLNDWYSATLERIVRDDAFSLKASDLSILWAKGEKAAEVEGLPRTQERVLRIVDNISSLDRFNPEKTWVEFVLTRVIPRTLRWNQVTMIGLSRGLHSDWVYKTLEGATDGVIDFRLDEEGEETRDRFRIRTMRNVNFERKWYPLNIGQNFEISLRR